jgi:murein DD-endopeptidase MepM/ murein hydrolase activator NlpD
MTLTVLAALSLTTVAFAQEAAPKGADAQKSAELQLVLATPKEVYDGQPFLVRLTAGQPMDKVMVYWLDREFSPSITVWNNRHVALVMLGTDVLTIKAGEQELVVVAIVNGERNTFNRKVRIIKRKYPTQRLTLPKKMVSPPKKEHERIANDRKAVKAALETISPQRRWLLPFERPVSGVVSSRYGLRRILNDKPKNPHRGLDLQGEEGTPVKAPATGEVILVDDHYYAGNSLYLDHGNGVITMYFHLAQALVEEGQIVRRGEKIGLVGKTGRATGAHLHWGVSVLGQLVDPEPLLENTVGTLLAQ